MEDGSYVRLKNIQIGYTVPNTRKFRLQSVRLYVAATNLLTFTGYTGFDPEMTVVQIQQVRAILPTALIGTYPVAKNYTFGLNISF